MSSHGPNDACELCEALRQRGWMVASHNDYPKDGRIRTYWSFSRGDQFVDGDGDGDYEALFCCLTAANRAAK
jgi:hypothetical protein